MSKAVMPVIFVTGILLHVDLRWVCVLLIILGKEEKVMSYIKALHVCELPDS